MSTSSGRRGESVVLRVFGALLLIGAAIGGASSIAGCAMATPFRGPGYSSRNGVTLAGVGETVWVGITNAVVNGSTRKVFDDYTRKVVRSLPTNDGFIGSSVRSRIFGNEVWTMTVWRDEAALDAFVSSPSHRAAMREGLAPVIRAKFLRCEVPRASVPPTWDDVLRQLEGVEYTNYDQGSAESPRR